MAWMRRDRALLPLIAAAALGCGGGTSRSLPVVSQPGPEQSALADRLGDIVTEALRADARGETADSLYALDAQLIADGRFRTTPPRFAGVGSGGQVAVNSSQIELRGALAWISLDYRWISTRENLAREAKATFVLAPDPTDRGRWRILHAHTSSVQP